MNLRNECQEAKVIIRLHFDKLEFGTEAEQAELQHDIEEAMNMIGELPEFEMFGYVEIETENPRKIKEILRVFGK